MIGEERIARIRNHFRMPATLGMEVVYHPEHSPTEIPVSGKAIWHFAVYRPGELLGEHVRIVADVDVMNINWDETTNWPFGGDAAVTLVPPNNKLTATAAKIIDSHYSMIEARVGMSRHADHFLKLVSESMQNCGENAHTMWHYLCELFAKDWDRVQSSPDSNPR